MTAATILRSPPASRSSAISIRAKAGAACLRDQQVRWARKPDAAHAAPTSKPNERVNVTALLTGAPSSDTLFTPRFFVMCSFTFTVFLSAFQLLPTAPFHIRDLGGTTFVLGLFLGFLTYASALSAPLTGAIADRIVRRCSFETRAFQPPIGTLRGRTETKQHGVRRGSERTRIFTARELDKCCAASSAL